MKTRYSNKINMLENTFQHGGKQIKTRNIFFSRTPRSIMEIGDIIPLCHTQNGLSAFISNTACCKSFRRLRTCLFQALFAVGTIADDRYEKNRSFLVLTQAQSGFSEKPSCPVSLCSIDCAKYFNQKEFSPCPIGKSIQSKS